jgi:hypothetical protein
MDSVCKVSEMSSLLPHPRRFLVRIQGQARGRAPVCSFVYYTVRVKGFGQFRLGFPTEVARSLFSGVGIRMTIGKGFSLTAIGGRPSAIGE